MKNTAIKQNDDMPSNSDKKQAELRQIALRLSQLPESKKGVFRQALKDRGINPWKLPITALNQERRDQLPLSFAQQRLWLLDQIDDKGGHAVISNALTLEGSLNKLFVTQAFKAILQRHESLRTCFEIDAEGQAHQVVQSGDSFSITEYDLSTLRAKDLQGILSEAKSTPFDLTQDLMLRVNLIALNEQQHVLQFITHHIASDGWSLAVLMKEFTALYNAYSKGHSADDVLPKLSIQYADYAHWQRDWLQGEELDQQLSYWREQLSNLPVVHDLPLDNARPAEQTFVGAKWHSELTEKASQQLRDYCQASQSTLFMGLHAVFSVLLARYSGQDDIVIGSPVANREQQEVTSLIGFFVNLLVLRSDLSDDPDFDTLLQRSKTCLLNAYEHQQVPFEELVEDLKPARSLSHSPLFQVMLVLQNNESADGLALEGLNAQAVVQEADTANYDLSLYVFERDNRLVLSWEYNTDLFRESTIARMAMHFENLVSSLLDAPNQSVRSATMLSADEQNKITRDWNTSSIDFEQLSLNNGVHASVDSLFSQQSKQSPNNIAAQFDGQQLTYAELENQSNELAHVLQAQGIGPNKLVGIVKHRSLSLLVSVLGVMKAGAAYVPIDPSYPQDRVNYMLDHAGLALLLVDQTVIDEDVLPSSVNTPTLNVCTLDDSLKAAQNYSSKPPVHDASESDLAYVIYTSGSTGKPKGVQITRGNLANFILGMQDLLALSADDRLLAVTSLSFDIATLELYLPLVSGAQVIIADEQLSMDGQRLKSVIETSRVSMMQATPVTWKLLLSAGWQHNSLSNKANSFTALCGGEAFPLELAHSLTEQPIKVWNLYGPTETTVWSAAYELNNNEGINNTVPIGKPIANTQLYVLDGALNPVPVGVTGELYIAGSGVAMGYLNNPELTEERFIEHHTFGRLYQTGDLARYRDNGVLECLGRIDNQVKVRGYRIELDEIEHCLLQHEQVIDAAVNTHNVSGEPVLVAYLVCKAGSTLLIDELKKHAGQSLPNYMLPSFLVELDALPLTPNGKVDRNALPQPLASAQQRVYAEPTTDTERLLCQVWQDVLDVEKIGINDNFFELGGHSLLVIRVITQLQELNINASVRDLFTLPCLRDLAFKLDSSDTTAPIFRAPERAIPELVESISPEMLPLVTLTQDEIDSLVNQVPGGVKNIEDIYPLGPLQEGIYFHHLMSKGNDPYVFSNVLKVESRAHLDKFIEALRFIVDRHDVLRTMIVSDGLPNAVQVVCKKAELPVEWLRVSSGQSASQMMQAMSDSDQQWLDISQAPLLSVSIAKDDDSDQHHVLLRYHHLISDHEGLSIIQREVMAFFSALSDSLPPAIPYREFVAHAQHQLEHGDADAFFTQMLSDIDEPTLPFGLTNTQSDGSKIIDCREPVDEKVATRIRSIAKTMQINPASLFHAAWAMVISACSGRESVVFGSVLSGRLQGTLGAEHMMGVFINTLPIRVDVDARNINAYVQAVHQSLTDLLSYEQTPLVLAQNCSGVASEQPLFSALINYRHSNANSKYAPVKGDLKNDQRDDNVEQGIDGVEFISGTVRNNYPLTLSIDDYGDHGFGLAGLFDQSVDADRVLSYVQNALALITDALVNEKSYLVNQLSVLGEQEHKTLKGQEVVETPASSIQTLFEKQVSLSPDNDALVFQEQKLSYQDLNQHANQLAHYLRAQGVSADVPVALYMERSPSLVVSILAVLKAGGCYLPLDTQWPQSRIQGILDDAKVGILLTEHTLVNELNELSDTNVCAIDDHDLLKTYGKDTPENKTKISDAAYIIYTSGSTGEPKGVVIEHRQLFNYVSGINARLDISGLSFAHVSTVAADLGNTSLFGALCFGGALHLIETQTAFDADNTATALADYPVDVLKIVPGHLQGLLAAENAQDILPKQLLIIGGEACSIALLEQVRSLNPELRIVNHYGPSETTVGVLTHEVSDVDIQSAQIPIGRALPNTKTLILDSAGKLVPQGVAGELFVGGLSVARGYLNRNELTAERFVDSELTSTKLYRTGDRVRQRADGAIEFLGRIDNQVKVRGYRVELGDIESALLCQSEVQQASVLLIEGDVNSRLVAFLQLSDIEASAEMLEKIKERLNQTLPEYMQPQQFVLLETIPRTLNGKVDRNALLAILEEEQKNETVSEQPRNETETILADVWCQVLQCDEVSIHDDFFAIGGDSILSLQVIARLKKQSIKLMPRTFFDYPTIAQLAEQVTPSKSEQETEKQPPATNAQASTNQKNTDDISLESNSNNDNSSHNSNQPLQLIRAGQGNTQTPVFCLHHSGGHTREYKAMTEQFEPSIPVYGIQSLALSDDAYNESDINTVAQYYAQVIQSVQPQGPYRLLGWSLGGVLAMAITEVFEAGGQEVSFLGLVDAILPQTKSDYLYESDLLLENLLAMYGEKATQMYAQVSAPLRNQLEQKLSKLDEHSALQFACDSIFELGLVDNEGFDKEYLKLNYRTAIQSRRLIQSFRPKKNKANATVWWARNSLHANDVSPTDWQQYCAGIVSEQIIDGGHFDIVKDGTLKQSVAQSIDKII